MLLGYISFLSQLIFAGLLTAIVAFAVLAFIFFILDII